MGFYATTPLPEVAVLPRRKTDLPSKNRVWNFFSVSRSRIGNFPSQPVETHRENEATSTKTVSGISLWLSRDPIGELGGINLYCFVENSPVFYYDYLGLNNPGCDVIGALSDCQLRCCAEHDKCYDDNDCSWLSWCSPIPPCRGCNDDAAGCFAACLFGIGPKDGPKYYCPNGPYSGNMYDDYGSVPASCWEGGNKPVPPTPPPPYSGGGGNIPPTGNGDWNPNQDIPAVPKP